MRLGMGSKLAGAKKACECGCSGHSQRRVGARAF